MRSVQPGRNTANHCIGAGATAINLKWPRASRREPGRVVKTEPVASTPLSERLDQAFDAYRTGFMEGTTACDALLADG